MRMISQLLLTFLLNACWQVALIVVFAAFCSRLLRETAAGHRHLLWVAALVLSLGLPALTCLNQARSSLVKREIKIEKLQQPLAIQGGAPQLTLLATPASEQETSSFIPIKPNHAAVLLGFYVLLLLYRGFSLFRAWARTRAIKRSAYPIELLEQVQTSIGKCQTAIGASRFRVLCSASVPGPVTIGSINPLIILTEELLREGDTDLLMSAIGHELAHVSRRDYFFNLLYELIYLPLSFHPAASLIRRRINQTRELRCDELVTEKLVDAKVYARSLVQLAGSALSLGRPVTTMTVGMADADNLEERIMTILGRPKISARRNSFLLVAASLCLAVPCLAAVPFALHINVNPQEPATGSQQDSKQKDELERRRKEEREQQELAGKGQEESKEQELEAHRREERAMMTKRQAELAKLARITMEQAIQIANSQQPGKVLECILGRERDEVVYRVLILSEDGTGNIVTRILINAVNGQVNKTEQADPGN